MENSARHMALSAPHSHAHSHQHHHHHHRHARHDQGRLHLLTRIVLPSHPCSTLCSVGSMCLPACLPACQNSLTRQPTPRDIALLLFHYMSGQRPHYSAPSGLALSALGLPPTTPTGPVPSRPCEYMYSTCWAMLNLAWSHRLVTSRCSARGAIIRQSAIAQLPLRPAGPQSEAWHASRGSTTSLWPTIHANAPYLSFATS